MSLEDRVAQLEFQQELLFDNTPLSRFVFECSISREQYSAIMDYMDSIRARLDDEQPVSHSSFEAGIYELIPEKTGDYHFCESIAKLFAEEGRWEEVFPAVYGDMPKYCGTVE